MELIETVIPANKETRTWKGRGVFQLSGGDTLKIESDDVEHLTLPIPQGATYSFKLNMAIEEI